MTRLSLLLMMSFALAACGPEDESNPGLRGRWYGTSSLSTGGVPATYNATLEIGAFDDRRLYASGVCPDGSGTMAIAGDGAVLSWSGSLDCAYPPGPACSTTTLRYTSAQGFVTHDGTLVIKADGTLVGCGASVPVTVSFYGHR